MVIVVIMMIMVTMEIMMIMMIVMMFNVFHHWDSNWFVHWDWDVFHHWVRLWVWYFDFIRHWFLNVHSDLLVKTVSFTFEFRLSRGHLLVCQLECALGMGPS